MRALYTIDTTTAQVRYAGNGVTTAAPVTFQFFEPTTLRVQTVVGEVATTRVLNVDYTVSGGAGETGTVTFATAPPSGTTVVIDLDIPLLQETIDLGPNGPLPAEDVEQGFDRVVTMVKQLNARLAATPRMSATYNPDNGEVTLPAPESGKVLIGNANGTGWENGSITVSETPIVLASPAFGDGLYYDDVNDTFRNVRQAITFEMFGAKGDADMNGGGTDDTAALSAAINYVHNSGGGTVFSGRPGARYRTTGTITIPVGVSVDLGGFLPGNPVAGTAIVADEDVQVAVLMGTASSNGTTGLKNGSVTRAGTPSTDKIGVFVYDGYNVVLDHVFSSNHGVGFYCQAHPAIGAGLSIRAVECHTSRISYVHLWVDGYPEVTWIGGRMGQNGMGDYAGHAFLLASGGVTGTAGGPNTVKCIGTQFNQGGVAGPSYWLSYVSLSDPYPGVAASTWHFSDCHIENVTTAAITSDSTWNIIDRLHITNCEFNCPSVPAFALNAGTKPSNWDFVGTHWFVSGFTLAPTDGIATLKMTGGYVSGPMSLTGTTGSTASLSGVGHGANFTLNGTWGAFSDHGAVWTAGTMVQNATGSLLFSSAQFQDRAWLRLFGTCDGSGDLIAAHGVAGLVSFLQVASAAFKTSGGAWTPMTVNYVDGTNISAAGGAPAAGRPYQILLMYGAPAHTGW